MAVYKDICRTSTLKHKVEVTCVMPIPDLSEDPTQAPACGTCISEKNENLERFVEEMLGPQYFEAMKRNILAYEDSQLPIRFLHGSKVVIAPLPIEVPACYLPVPDIIMMDNDAVCGMKHFSGEFVMGHELGHKILWVKLGKEELLKRISDILMVNSQSNDKMLKELIADEVGNLISGDQVDRQLFSKRIDERKREGIQRKILHFIWN